ncbi:MAG: hydrolase [Gemmatimonadota bacterium]
MSDGSRQPFRAPWWARGPHGQTLLARALRSPNGPTFERERIETPDGDFLDLDWTADPSDRAPIALILHGLEGNARRRYVRNVARELLSRGVRCVGLNFRGCSGEPNRALRFYHSGETTDATLVLELIRSRYPDRRVGAVGFSLGGNVLLKLMGERPDGGTGLLDAAAAMSVPYDLAAGCAELERGGMARVYTRYFMRSLQAKLAAKAEALANHVDVATARTVRSIRAFDELVTAPLNGFADAGDYYRRSSSKGFLGNVKVPTLLLHASDDPFLPASSIPREEATANPALTLALSDRGGHVGFVCGTPKRPEFWGDEAAAAHVARVLRGADPIGTDRG